LRRIGDERHRLEIPDDVIWQALGCAVDDMRLHMPEAERVAIGCRAGDTSNADRAAGAAHIFNDDRLAEESSHRLGQDAPQGVRRAARRIRHDHRDRARWIGLP
jgi:hypothetical protein